MDSLSDVIKELKCGNIDKFDLIVSTYQSSILRFCTNMLGSKQEAEDAAQDIFIKTYEKIYLFDEKYPFKPWIYKIASNHCINILKRRKILYLIPFTAELETPDKRYVEDAFTDELSEEVLTALSVLTATERSIFIWRTLDIKDYNELSKILGLNPATVRKKYERTRRKLEKLIKSRREECLNVTY